MAKALHAGRVSLDYVEGPAFQRFAALSGKTFARLADETGIPVSLLFVVREATGFAMPVAADVVRSDELAIITLIRAMLDAGLPEREVERALRAYGDSARRIAETENAWFQEYVIAPFIRSGRPWSEMNQAIGKLAGPLEAAGDPGILAIIHAQQSHTWLQAILDQFEAAVPVSPVGDRGQPAICFLDLTGYTRLTEERGDRAAADVAADVARLVTRSAVSHGGRAIKWLGDGVMFHFRAPAQAVVAALEMVEASATAGLPPAHVGLHSGPVLFQEGDYFGRTVNAASRIADYARPGEVLVTREVADVADSSGVSFTSIGPVVLKGMSEALVLLSASRSPGTSSAPGGLTQAEH